MRAVIWWVLLGSLGCGRGYRGPNCDDVQHSPVQVDITADPIRFFWEGDNPNGFAVLDDLGTPAWELVCECERNADVVGGEADCRDRGDWDFLACLPLDVTYGEIPDVDTISRENNVQWEAAPLVPGATYTALIWTTCEGRGFRDQVRFTNFLAPADPKE